MYGIANNQEDRTHAFHQYTIRINQKSNLGRDQILKKLDQTNRGEVYYPKPLHIYPTYLSLAIKLGTFQMQNKPLVKLYHTGSSRSDGGGYKAHSKNNQGYQ